MKIETILRELEKQGARNDEVQTDKAQKYLNITRDTGEFLRFLVLATHSKRILEIGTSNGYSTIWLAASVSSDGIVTTIESSKWKAEEAISNFERAGVTKKIVLLQEEAETAIVKLNSQYDFIFLDADRSKYMSMLNGILRLLKAGGILVCDNAVSHESELSDFMDYFKSQPNYSSSLVPVGKGEFLIYKF